LDHNNSQYWVKAVLNIRSRQFSIMDQDNSQYWIKTTLNIGLRQFSILDQDNSQYWTKTILNIGSRQFLILNQNNYQYWVKNIYDIGSRQLSSLLFCLFSFFLLTIILSVLCITASDYTFDIFKLFSFNMTYQLSFIINLLMITKEKEFYE
jgi:hypothetical protein